MKTNYILSIILIAAGIGFTSCGVPKLAMKETNIDVPEQYPNQQLDTNTIAKLHYSEFFDDPVLIHLIDTALQNNKELNVLLQTISIAQNEVQARTGEYLPSVSIGGEAETEKVGEYTRNGAVEQQLTLDGNEFQEPLGNLNLGFQASWEVDIWKKLRNAKKSAVQEFLASQEAVSFFQTQLVAEIASTYYELLALENQVQIVKENLAIQQNAFEVVKLLKENAKTTELAVKRFQAELAKNKGELVKLQQEYQITENRLNVLLGSMPKQLDIPQSAITDYEISDFVDGVPAQLLANRPDIRKAEYELAARKLDIAVAKAKFYPSLDLKAGLGFEAFQPQMLLQAPQSLAYSIGGGLIAPLVNKKGIQAEYQTANSRQIQAAYEYEQTVLQAYCDVVNALTRLDKLSEQFILQSEQTNTLVESIELSNLLFQSARADYMEVLLTQRDALESKMDLVETRKAQLLGKVELYKALGGGQ